MKNNFFAGENTLECKLKMKHCQKYASILHVLTFLEIHLLLLLDRVLEHNLQQLLNVAQQYLGGGKSDWRRPGKVALIKVQL